MLLKRHRLGMSMMSLCHGRQCVGFTFGFVSLTMGATVSLVSDRGPRHLARVKRPRISIDGHYS